MQIKAANFAAFLSRAAERDILQSSSFSALCECWHWCLSLLQALLPLCNTAQRPYFYLATAESIRQNLPYA